MAVGFNENWHLFPGMVVVNKRGQERSFMAWEDILEHGTEGASPQSYRTWKAKHGSVTFNCFGEHYPIYGVNEKGLYLAELYLEGTSAFKEPDQQFLFYPLWIQYQLDHFATVEELVKQVRSGPMPQYWPVGDGAHFFVSDATGATAELSFKNQRIKVVTEMPVKALCNAEYEQELAKLPAYEAFGGSKPFDRDDNEKKWPLRFVKAAHLMKDFSNDPSADLNESTWRVIDSVIPGSWQMVYNYAEKRMYYRTRANEGMRFVDLSRLDFAKPGSLGVDINDDATGDQTGKLKPISATENRAIIQKALPIGCPHKEFLESPDLQRIADGLATMPTGAEK